MTLYNIILLLFNSENSSHILDIREKQTSLIDILIVYSYSYSVNLL